MKRLILAFFGMFLVMGLIIGGLAYFKVNQIMGFIKLAQSGAFAPPPTAVSTLVVGKSAWVTDLRAMGWVAPVNGVTLSTDLEGIVERIAFESGTRLRKGDLMVQVDVRQEEAQLVQAVARRDLARLTLRRDQDLLAQRTIAKSEYDSAEADYRQAQATVDLYQATIDKKTIRAPFDGVAGIRRVDVGQYITPGEPVVSFHSFNPVYVNFSVPQQSLGRVKLGQEVTLRVNAFPDETFKGTVTAINSLVDPGSRNVQVQATVRSDEEKLRPGTFVDVRLALETKPGVMAVPASAIDYSVKGTAVYVLTEGKDKAGKPMRAVRRQAVTLGDSRGDQIAVVAGLKPGDEVVTAGVFRLHDGAGVIVNNSIQPENEPAPAPADS
jgi:membrane fusion protein, multidrug efflux system